MKQLTKEQLSVLATLATSDLFFVEKDNESICRYLESNHLARTLYSNTYRGRVLIAEITEEGRSYLATFEEDKNRYASARTISIIALVISGIALVVSTFAAMCANGIIRK